MGGFPATGDRTQLVVFRLDERRYALPLAAVQRAVRAVDVATSTSTVTMFKRH